MAGSTFPPAAIAFQETGSRKYNCQQLRALMNVCGDQRSKILLGDDLELGLPKRVYRAQILMTLSG